MLKIVAVITALLVMLGMECQVEPIALWDTVFNAVCFSCILPIFGKFSIHSMHAENLYSTYYSISFKNSRWYSEQS